MRKSLIAVSTLLALSVVPAGLGAAERVSFQQVLKLTAADTAGGDEFGTSLAMSGERVIVGAFWDDDRGSASGSAYIFERSPGGDPGDWKEVAKLVAPDGVAGDWFGGAVALSGDRALVGAFHEGTGYAYVFERDGSGDWVAVKKLLAGDFDPIDGFGAAVAIRGETAVVVATGARGPGGDSFVGAVYVYERDAGGPANWGQVAKLTPAHACDVGDPARDSTACGWVGDKFFGSAVALSDDLLLVGGGSGKGYFYIFRRVGEGPDSWWQRVSRVSALEPVIDDGFGSALAMSGGTVWAGAWGDDDLGSQAGAAYVFEPDRAGLLQTEKLYAPDAEGGIYFGQAVAMSGETAVVGSPDMGGSFRGQAYVFRRREGSAGGWEALARLEPPGLEHSDNFSTNAVAIRGGTIAIGAHGDDDRGTNAGAVYIYEETVVDPRLALSGSCPGEILLAASGLTPKGEVAVYGSPTEGPFALPDGFCAGTELGLAEAELLATDVVVGEAGTLRTTPVLPEAACSSYLQLLDLTSCAVSSVEPVP